MCLKIFEFVCKKGKNLFSVLKLFLAIELENVIEKGIVVMYLI